MKTLHLTLKMTTAQVVETSVTNNSLSGDYSHPDDNTRQITNYLFMLISQLLIKVLLQFYLQIQENAHQLLSIRHWQTTALMKNHLKFIAGQFIKMKFHKTITECT